MASLTEGELEVLQILWDHGPLKPSEIQEKFPRPIKNATLRSALRVLLDKRHVARKKEGKAYYYRPKTPMTKTFRSMTRRLADVFCGGSSVGLIAQLIESEELSADDIRELRRITNQKSAVKGKRRREEGS